MPRSLRVLLCGVCKEYFSRRRDIPLRHVNYCGWECREKARVANVLAKSRAKILQAIEELAGTEYGMIDIARKAKLNKNTVTRHFKMMREERKSK